MKDVQASHAMKWDEAFFYIINMRQGNNEKIQDVLLWLPAAIQKRIFSSAASFLRLCIRTYLYISTLLNDTI